MNNTPNVLELEKDFQLVQQELSSEEFDIMDEREKEVLILSILNNDDLFDLESEDLD